MSEEKAKLDFSSLLISQELAQQFVASIAAHVMPGRQQVTDRVLHKPMTDQQAAKAYAESILATPVGERGYLLIISAADIRRAHHENDYFQSMLALRRPRLALAAADNSASPPVSAGRWVKALAGAAKAKIARHLDLSVPEEPVIERTAIGISTPQLERLIKIAYGPDASLDMAVDKRLLPGKTR